MRAAAAATCFRSIMIIGRWHAGKSPTSRFLFLCDALRVPPHAQPAANARKLRIEGWGCGFVARSTGIRQIRSCAAASFLRLRTGGRRSGDDYRRRRFRPGGISRVARSPRAWHRASAIPCSRSGGSCGRTGWACRPDAAARQPCRIKFTGSSISTPPRRPRRSASPSRWSARLAGSARSLGAFAA